DRMAKGWPEAWMDFMNPHRLSYRLPDVLKHRGLYPFAAAVIFLAAALLAVSRRKSVDRDGLKLPGGSGAMVLFTLIACAGYGAWYGWTYGFQSEGLAVLYLPLMLSLTAGAESLMILARMRGSRRWIWQGYQVVMWVVVAAAATGVILSLRA
ncbi:MAG TPA: hypothetical protein VHM91_07040, partial [Verrucomicrobiales bacterium]|nr:hypothetical protein [Verrucomicrobiales bacterium]